MKINLLTETSSSPIYKQQWFILVVCILGVIILAGLIVLLCTIIHRQTCKKRIKDLQNRYDEIRDSFTNDCSNMISRIEVIAKYNPNFVTVYKSAQQDFQRILTDNDKVCYTAIAALKNMLLEKRFKDTNSIVSSTKISIDRYAKESNELNERLQSILKKEEDLRTNMVSLKEKFRDLKETYNNNLQALEPIASSFNYLFDHLTSIFIKFEDYLNKADYENASSILPQIEVLIDATNKVMSDLPYLTSLAFTVIPENIQELENTYNELENQGYPLHNLNANNAIKLMNEQLDLCKQKISQLSISGVNKTLDDIKMRINQFLKKFDDEKKAKVEFEESNKFINKESYSIQQKYANLISNLQQYQKVYVISKTYTTQIGTIKTSIDKMDNLIRTLDAFVNSATKQPYSVLMNTVKQINSYITKIESEFDSFREYLLSLKNDAERAYNFIRNGYEKLKDLESKIYIENVENFYKLYKEKFDEIVQQLNLLNSILTNFPIDANQLNSTYNDVKNNLDEVITEYQDKLNTLIEAENAIVYDNRFRNVSTKCENDLVAVENSFNEADFSRAKMIAVNIYKSETQEG